MISAWTRRFLLSCCLAWPVACVVSVGDDDDIEDGLPGASGSTGRAGSAGASGESGSGGSAGSAGSAGTNAGGTGGSDIIDTPVCTDEAEDDECITCIKQQCCVEWQACNTTTCQAQTDTMIACVDGSGDPDLYNDVCIPEAADPDDFLAENTLDLLRCINDFETDAGLATKCGVPCFGDDLFMD